MPNVTQDGSQHQPQDVFRQLTDQWELQWTQRPFHDIKITKVYSRDSNVEGLYENSATNRLNSSHWTRSLRQILIEQYFKICPNPISSFIYPQFLSMYREMGFQGVIFASKLIESQNLIGTKKEVLQRQLGRMPLEVQKECFEVILMAFVVTGARASLHSSILGTEIACSALAPRTDFKKVGSSREPFCRRLTAQLWASILRSGVFQLDIFGLLGIVALMDVVMGLLHWATQEEARQFRDFICVVVNELRRLSKTGGTEGLVEPLVTRIWCLDIDIARQLKQPPFLQNEDIIRLFSLSDCPPEYLLSCHTLLESEPTQDFADGFPRPGGGSLVKFRILSITLYTLQRTTLLSSFSVSVLPFHTFLQHVEGLLHLQSEHIKWFHSHRQFIANETSSKLSQREIKSRRRVFILQDVENVFLTFTIRAMIDQAKERWGDDEECKEGLRQAEAEATARVEEGIATLVSLCPRDLLWENVEELCGPKALFILCFRRAIEALPGGSEYFYTHFANARTEEERILRLTQIQSLLDFSSPSVLYGTGYLDWLHKFEIVRDRCFSSFLPETVEGFIFKEIHESSVTTPPQISPVVGAQSQTSPLTPISSTIPKPVLSPSHLSHRQLHQQSTASSTSYFSSDLISTLSPTGRILDLVPTSMLMLSSEDEREETVEINEKNRKRKRRMCRRCRKSSCLGYKDILLCPQPPKTACVTCHQLNCIRGADDGRDCSNIPELRSKLNPLRPPKKSGEARSEKERRKRRTCRRCRDVECRGYVDIALCTKQATVACIKCNSLDCLGGVDRGRHCRKATI